MRLLRHAIFLILPLPLLCTGCQSLSDFDQRISNAVTGHTPRAAAVQMEDPYFPDERRIGINRLSALSFGRQPPYTTRYEQIAQSDPDWLVRSTAIRALNRSRWSPATPIFIKALDDANAHVRLEAAKALGNVPDSNAIPSLLRLVNDTTEDRDVRIASADALKNFKTVEVARTLANQLGGREFAVAWQSHRSLEVLTGRDLHYDEVAWLNYITGPEKPLG
jgi:HEAT repeat protein